MINLNGRGNGSSVCVIFSSPDDAPLSFLTGGVDEVNMATLEIDGKESITFTPEVFRNSSGNIVIAFREDIEDDEEKFSYASFSVFEVKTIIQDLQSAFDNALEELKG